MIIARTVYTNLLSTEASLVMDIIVVLDFHSTRIISL